MTEKIKVTYRYNDDPQGAIRYGIEQNGAVYGFAYVEEARDSVFYNPKENDLAAAGYSAFPDDEPITIISKGE